MANLTSEDVCNLIEASYWKHPFNGDGNVFTLPVLTDFGSQWVVCIRLIDGEGDKAQRLEISSSTNESIPVALRQKAYEFCNQWQDGYSYIQTWFSEEDGKVCISASVENPGELLRKWLVESFVNLCLQLISRFQTETWMALGGLEKFKMGNNAQMGAMSESGSESQEALHKVESDNKDRAKAIVLANYMREVEVPGVSFEGAKLILANKDLFDAYDINLAENAYWKVIFRRCAFTIAFGIALIPFIFAIKGCLGIIKQL